MKSGTVKIECKVNRFAIAAAVGVASTGWAATHNWNQTAAGAFDWNNPGNWVENTGFPNAAGAVANLNSDLAGAQSVYLREDITVGVLNIGDAAATGANFSFFLSNYPGQTTPTVIPAESFTLTFDNGSSAAEINLGTTGTALNTINAPIQVNSDLRINMGLAATISAYQRLQLGANGSTNAINLGSHNLTVVGGYTNQSTSSQSLISVLAGTDLIGSGTISIDGKTQLSIQGTIPSGVDNTTGVSAKAFTGKVILNGGAYGAANTGTLNLFSGSLKNASEIVINGSFTGAGASGNPPSNNAGAVVSIGGGTIANHAGQRLSSSKVTFNGGTLMYTSQTVTNGAGIYAGDTVNTVNFNSGTSLVTLAASATVGGTRFEATNMLRGPGAAVVFKAPAAGAPPTPFTAPTHGAGFLKTSGTGTGNSTGIVPWLTVGPTTAGWGYQSFATYDSGGFRQLATGEFETSLVAGANVKSSTVAVPGTNSTLAVNSLLYSGGSTNIGSGNTLQVSTGGLIITNTNASIGATGNAAAGTLAFGNAEAVIWNGNNTAGANTSTIGAAITGTGGLTMAGVVTLMLTGNNSIIGDTHVSAGTLKVGNGTTHNSSIGDGDVFVHGGATLDLAAFNAVQGSVINYIADDATLTLMKNGLNGKINLSVNGIEAVAALNLGGQSMVPGYYGSAAAAAAYAGLLPSEPIGDNTYFAGLGLVQVVPEPAGLLGLLLAPVILRRRRDVSDLI